MNETRDASDADPAQINEVVTVSAAPSGQATRSYASPAPKSAVVGGTAAGHGDVGRFAGDAGLQH